MTDQDNLRDRIADLMERIGYEWDAQMMASIVDDKPAPPKSLADTQAQAIIDEFVLTVESRFVYATDLARDDEPVTEDMAQRVVGKWEKQ